jgi:ABC-type multidrug transport system fused ATPase/permease subunit
MDNQIDSLRAVFKQLNTAQKLNFIEDLKAQSAKTKAAGHIKFLNECILIYNDEIRANDARIKAEREQRARERAEQIRLERERQAQHARENMRSFRPYTPPAPSRTPPPVIPERQPAIQRAPSETYMPPSIMTADTDASSTYFDGTLGELIGIKLLCAMVYPVFPLVISFITSIVIFQSLSIFLLILSIVIDILMFAACSGLSNYILWNWET